jgi:glycosyltransferase involved in cell wall biosynthesis
MPTLGVYLPAFNEAETIGALLDAIPAAIPGITALKKIVVDDGSTDRTADVAQAHGAQRAVGESRILSNVAYYTLRAAPVLISAIRDHSRRSRRG